MTLCRAVADDQILTIRNPAASSNVCQADSLRSRAAVMISLSWFTRQPIHRPRSESKLFEREGTGAYIIMSNAVSCALGFTSGTTQSLIKTRLYPCRMAGRRLCKIEMQCSSNQLWKQPLMK